MKRLRQGKTPTKNMMDWPLPHDERELNDVLLEEPRSLKRPQPSQPRRRLMRAIGTQPVEGQESEVVADTEDIGFSLVPPEAPDDLDPFGFLEDA